MRSNLLPGPSTTRSLWASSFLLAWKFINSFDRSNRIKEKAKCSLSFSDFYCFSIFDSLGDIDFSILGCVTSILPRSALIPPTQSVWELISSHAINSGSVFPLRQALLLILSDVCRWSLLSLGCRRSRWIGFPLLCSVFLSGWSKYSKLIRFSSLAQFPTPTLPRPPLSGPITIRSQPLHFQRMSRLDCVFEILRVVWVVKEKNLSFMAWWCWKPFSLWLLWSCIHVGCTECLWKWL